MKWMGWSLVCEHNEDGVVVRWCNNINTTEVEYTNKTRWWNKMVTSTSYNECFHCSLFNISSWFDYSSSWSVCAGWYLSKFSRILLSLSTSPGSVADVLCLVYSLVSMLLSMSFSVLTKFETILIRWRLFLRITLSLLFINV